MAIIIRERLPAAEAANENKKPTHEPTDHGHTGRRIAKYSNSHTQEDESVGGGGDGEETKLGEVLESIYYLCHLQVISLELARLPVSIRSFFLPLQESSAIQPGLNLTVSFGSFSLLGLPSLHAIHSGLAISHNRYGVSCWLSKITQTDNRERTVGRRRGERANESYWGSLIIETVKWTKRTRPKSSSSVVLVVRSYVPSFVS